MFAHGIVLGMIEEFVIVDAGVDGGDGVHVSEDAGSPPGVHVSEDAGSSSPTSSSSSSCPVSPVKPTKIVLFEYKQNDPKRDTGMKLARQGLVRSLRPGDPFKGIVLSAQGRCVLSAADFPIISSAGLGAVNCSWNRLDEITNVPGGNIARHRKLPFLIAANPTNYGKAYKLSSAEALAAALAIAGLEKEGKNLASKFAWSEEFWKLNDGFIQVYRECANSAEIIQAQNRFMTKDGFEKEFVSYDDVAGVASGDIGQVRREKKKSVSFAAKPDVLEFTRNAPLVPSLAPSSAIVIIDPIIETEITDIASGYPEEAPKDMRRCLLFLRDIGAGGGHIPKHASGNSLAKTKRKDYLAMWKEFIEDEANLRFYTEFVLALGSSK